jgi:hypothetical protein
VNYRTAILALFLTVPVLAQAPQSNAAKPDATKVVLTIGDVKLTAADFDEIINSLPAQFQAQARSGAGRRSFAEQYIQLRLLADAAAKEKIDQTDKVKKQIAFSNMTIFASAMFQYMQDNVKVDDANSATRKLWPKRKASASGSLKAKTSPCWRAPNPTIRARHRAVRSRNSARA